ncbi:hypothetical protein [Faecalispora jeddahensis]|uniref:hypothetical protein n=1 Tax=Faecalispora jeddahensis TaxID=1414721 RepID=UPI0004B37816|nr:hypothetical protein [Faecalispora jeddahensis]
MLKFSEPYRSGSGAESVKNTYFGSVTLPAFGRNRSKKPHAAEKYEVKGWEAADFDKYEIQYVYFVGNYPISNMDCPVLQSRGEKQRNPQAVFRKDSEYTGFSAIRQYLFFVLVSL